MRENINNILKLCFNSEGGYVNHPDDPGGPTNHGITQGTLSTALGRPASIDDVKKLTKEGATRIYLKMYIAPVGGHVLPAGLDYAMVDFGINSGPARAVKTLQSLLPGVGVDGVFGEKTRIAVEATDTAELITKLCHARLDFCKKLKTWRSFGRGWTYRVIGKDPKGQYPAKRGVLGDALDMAAKRPLKFSEMPSTANVIPVGKARDENVKILGPLRNKIQAVGIGSATLSGMVQAAGNYLPHVQSFASSIEPYKDNLKFISIVFTVCMIGAAVITLLLNIDKIREAGTHA